MWRKLLSAATLACWLASASLPAFGQADTVVTPSSPLSMSGLAAFLDGAMLSVGSCNYGPSAPSNGPSSAPFLFECWANTTTSTAVVFSYYDGASWVKFGTLNESTHVWTPYVGANQVSGGVPYGASASTMGWSAALTQYGVVYGGGAGGAPAVTAAAGSQDYFFQGGSPPTWGAIPPCTGALTYVSHALGCNTGTGTGTVTEQKNTAGAGLSTSGNCDNTSSNSGSPCNYVNTGLITITPQILTSSGTYTPTSGMKYTEVICTATGGTGGSAGAGGAGGGGGGAGETVFGTFSAASIGASQTVTIGAAGNNTTLGSLLTAVFGANGSNAGATTSGGQGGLGGSGGTTQSGNPDDIGGDGVTGSPAESGTFPGMGGTGGASFWGSGGAGGVAGSTAQVGRAYGSGGGGAGTSGSGAAGKTGVCVFRDFS